MVGVLRADQISLLGTPARIYTWGLRCRPRPPTGWWSTTPAFSVDGDRKPTRKTLLGAGFLWLRGTRSNLPLWLRGTRSNGSWGRRGRGSIFFGSGSRSSRWRNCPRRPTFSPTRTAVFRPPVVFPTVPGFFGRRVGPTAVTAVDWHWLLTP